MKIKKPRSKTKFTTSVEGPERAIQSMFMVVIKNHVHLSKMADRKANLILVICALMVSTVMTNSYKFIGEDNAQYLWIPTAIFIGSMVTAMVLSIVTTIPKVTTGIFSKQDILDKSVNLAFFGNFHHMELEDYEWAVSLTLKDKDAIYNSLTKDLYFLGIVLDKKFRRLNTTYTVLIAGMIISVIAYGLSFYFGSEVAL